MSAPTKSFYFPNSVLFYASYILFLFELFFPALCVFYHERVCSAGCFTCFYMGFRPQVVFLCIYLFPINRLTDFVIRQFTWRIQLVHKLLCSEFFFLPNLQTSQAAALTCLNCLGRAEAFFIFYFFQFLGFMVVLKICIKHALWKLICCIWSWSFINKLKNSIT